MEVDTPVHLVTSLSFVGSLVLCACASLLDLLT